MFELVDIKKDIAWLIEQVKCLLTKSLAATAWSENHTAETGGNYTVNTIVWYQGCIYRCTRNNNSVVPTDTVYWSNMGEGLLLEETIPNWLAPRGRRSFIQNKPTKTSDFINDGEGGSKFVTEDFVNQNDSSDKNYVHFQIGASNAWTVNHNLGKFASVTIVDSGNNVVIGDYEIVDQNQVILRFSAPFSGKAFFN
jgi:hypothetical protein